MIKKYKIENFANFWSCTIEIEADKVLQEFSKPGEPYTTSMLMKEMILFWTGGKERLACNDGNVEITFAQQLAREAFLIQAEHRCNLLGVLNELKEREGWHSFDGRVGIKLTEVDDLEFDYYEFEVEELL